MWVKVHAKQKVVICGVYLRCNPGIYSEANESNEALLNQIHVEAQHLRRQGFRIVMMGDLNAHGGDCEQFGFSDNPHPVNTNGSLLIDWLNVHSMKCLNDRAWVTTAGDRVCAKGRFSFQWL